MNLEKLNPWNWFKHENGDRPHQVPVTRREAEIVSPTSHTDSIFRLHREMDRLFDDAFSAFGMPSIRSSGNRFIENGRTGLIDHYRPQIDVTGDENQYHIALDVPGLSESDLSIEINGDVLVVKGKKEEKHESRDKHFYRVERSYGSFQRTLSLPEDANSDEIAASLKDGVLKLEIPRRQTEPGNVKRISISS